MCRGISNSLMQALKFFFWLKTCIVEAFYVVFYEKNCFLLRFCLIHSVSRETLCEIERFLFVFCLAIAQCPDGGVKKCRCLVCV